MPLEAKSAADAVAENERIKIEKDRRWRERVDSMARELAARKEAANAAADADIARAQKAREAAADAELDAEVRRTFLLGNPSGSEATFQTVRDELRRAIILRRSEDALNRARGRAWGNL